MHPVFAQMLDQQTAIPSDPLERLDDVWNKMIYPTTVLSNWQSYWDPQIGDCKLQEDIHFYESHVVRTSKIHFLTKAFIPGIILCNYFSADLKPFILLFLQ